MTNTLRRNEVLKPYFNMKRFEDVIYNKYEEREKRIKIRKRLRILDRFLVVIATLLFVVMAYIVLNIIVQNIKIVQNDKEIARLENTLEKIKCSNDSYIREMKSEIKFDELKMKAYMDLNMITPTEKNIIYFDKSDDGFVHQYENIR